MWFNSWEFLFFLPTVLVVYYCLAHRAQNIWLLAASYFFYGWWDWRFLSLILLSTVTDFFIAQFLDRETATSKRRLALGASLCINLGLLGTFKYFNFFVDTFIELGAALGLNFDTPVLRLVPPVGISFYTFQTMAYTIDVYRRETKPTTRFFDFALFVCYFPQLVAGPIERSRHLLPQILKRRVVTWQNINAGMTLILIGLFKKVAIADFAGTKVDEIFSDPGSMSTVLLWKGVLLFSVQIYGDFSGYSNIARGVSKLFGIELHENFLTPYLSRNITEFWQRWHVTLSRWLRDYLYVSMGGNRHGRVRTYRNLFITMLLGGLWHGASWNFVIWGALHGSYLAIHRLLSEHARADYLTDIRGLLTIKGVLSVLATFLLVSLTWVFFRCDDLGAALEYLHGLGAFRGPFNARQLLLPVVLLCATWCVDLVQRKSENFADLTFIPVPVRGLAYGTCILAVILLSGNEIPFIYFQF